MFPFDEDEPVEDQIKAGKFNFPDEYWGNISDEGQFFFSSLLSVLLFFFLSKNKRQTNSFSLRPSPWHLPPAIDLICNLLVVDPKERASIDDVLKHPWFNIQGPLRL